MLADLVGLGATYTAARGGRGGLGNGALASRARKAPGFALLGEPGESADVVLELKSVADVGLVGFPSAGKSSLVSVLSAARPKIADYPFTTLEPNLGVVTAGSEVYTIADVPGLIPGASQGKGLGLEFLRHVERCAVLVHVIDCATYETGRDPLSDIMALEFELAEYTPALATDFAAKPRLVVLNKIDVPEARELAEFVTPDLEAAGHRVIAISAVTHEGLPELRFALAEVVAADRAAKPTAPAPRIVVRPKAIDSEQFQVEPDPEVDGGFIVRGSTPGTLDPADRLQQRRGRRLPRRPAGPARRRGAAGRARRPSRRAGDHRQRDLRLGADHAGRRRRRADRSRHRPAAGPGRTDRRLGTQGAAPAAPRAGRRGPQSRDELRRVDDVRPCDGGVTTVSARTAVRERFGGRRGAVVTDAAEPIAAVEPAPSRPGPPLSAARLAVGRAKIVVVKVGSSSLTTAAGGLDPNRLDALVDAVAGRVAAGSQVVLVSSGAIAAGSGAAGPRAGARVIWPPSRPRRRSASSCWPSATPDRSPGTG